MREAGKHAVVLDVCDILNRLGLSRESITHLLEADANLVKTQADPHALLVRSEYTQ